MTTKWIQQAFAKHKGALHRQLDVPEGETIPIHLLEEIVHKPIGDFIWNYHNVYKIKVTKLLKERAQAALNAEKRLHHNVLRIKS